MTEFELGRIIYEAGIRFAWGKQAEARLMAHPYPRHIADPNTQTAAADIAMAQARAAFAALNTSAEPVKKSSEA